MTNWFPCKLFIPKIETCVELRRCLINDKAALDSTYKSQAKGGGDSAHWEEYGYGLEVWAKKLYHAFYAWKSTSMEI